MESIRDYDVVYKIGYSKNPKKRLLSVQTGNDGIVRILYEFKTRHGRSVESALHRFYSHFHKNMEWFFLDLDAVVDFLPLCEKIEKNLDIISSD